ncbi:MAG TPA: hypothetical protein VG013_20415 [Gemmataceae bacterium]|jgi:serine/threonine protein kinase|nr:hypothetical protein [Gemmataceae bacterium]
MCDILDLRDGKTHKGVGGRYTATACLGKGRFAEVYRAFDERSCVDVALKIYSDPVTAKDNRAKREQSILEAMAQAGTEFFPTRASLFRNRFAARQHHCLVMELGEYHWEERPEGAGPGVSRTKLRTAILPLSRVLPDVGGRPPEVHRPEFWEPEALSAWLLDLCEAVRLMHESGKERPPILHLDLKPDNILLKRGPGRERAVPFLIDYNTSVRDSCEPFTGGTPGYQAPEVRDGRRKTPAAADDLYALAKVIWEIHFGLGAAGDAGARTHSLVLYPCDAVRFVLLRALHPDPARRFATAAELRAALHDALRPAAPAICEGGLSPAEMTGIRELAPAIRENIEEILTGSLSLYIPKAVRDEVASLFGVLPSETTESYDLRDRLVQLGPKAIATIFEEGYRLDVGTPAFGVVIEALAELGRGERERLRQNPRDFPPDRALKSIEQYCLSSSFGVRRLSRALCKRLELFPRVLLDSILGDKEIYLPQERAELADLCLRLSQEDGTALCLMKYVCAEYLLEPSKERYWDLYNRVTSRFGQLRAKCRVTDLEAWAHDHVWEELDEFRGVPEAQRVRLSVKLLQLLADAFAALGDEALEALKQEEVRIRCKDNLRIWATFVWKLCRQHDPARAWWESLSATPPSRFAREVEWVREKFEVQRVAPGRLFDEYVSEGSHRTAQRLGNSEHLAEVLARVPPALVEGADPRRLMVLLQQCRDRCRPEVLHIAFQNWPAFADADYDLLLEIVCANGKPPGMLREMALQRLYEDRRCFPDRRERATQWVERLLED